MQELANSDAINSSTANENVNFSLRLTAPYSTHFGYPWKEVKLSSNIDNLKQILFQHWDVNDELSANELHTFFLRNEANTEFQNFAEKIKHLSLTKFRERFYYQAPEPMSNRAYIVWNHHEELQSCADLAWHYSQMVFTYRQIHTCNYWSQSRAENELAFLGEKMKVRFKDTRQFALSFIIGQHLATDTGFDKSAKLRFDQLKKMDALLYSPTSPWHELSW